MIRSLKIRLYPTKEQEILMNKHIDACRFWYNYMLELQNKRFERHEEILSRFEMCGLITVAKKNPEYQWLKEIGTHSLQIVCRDLDCAYTNMFCGRANRPKFKSKKKAKRVFPIDQEILWFDKKHLAHISKIGKVKFKTDYDLPVGTSAKFTNARVSNIGNKWILTFGLEVENQNLELTNDSMGIDLGVKETATVAIGTDKVVIHNINKSKRVRFLNKEISRVQKSISRKYEANKVGNVYVKTRNIEKLEIKLRRLYARVANIQQNYIHQSTHSLIMMRPSRIVIEDLNVIGMMKNRHLSKAVLEQGFHEWRRQLEYKCEFYGIPLVVADRFYPSSKTCYCCKAIKSDLKLSDRTYVCSECGYVEDRDFNAALNLMSYEV